MLHIKQDFHMLVVNPRKQKLCIQVKDSVGLTDITIGTGEVGFDRQHYSLHALRTHVFVGT
jgi:hypothetical protein